MYSKQVVCSVDARKRAKGRWVAVEDAGQQGGGEESLQLSAKCFQHVPSILRAFLGQTMDSFGQLRYADAPWRLLIIMTAHSLLALSTLLCLWRLCARWWWLRGGGVQNPEKE